MVAEEPSSPAAEPPPPMTADEAEAVAEVAAMENLEVILALGGIAHNTVLSTLGERRASYKFAHCVMHKLSNGLILADSYHCSRYNTNTGRLNEEMFEDVFRMIRETLAG